MKITIQIEGDCGCGQGEPEDLGGAILYTDEEHHDTETKHDAGEPLEEL